MTVRKVAAPSIRVIVVVDPRGSAGLYSQCLYTVVKKAVLRQRSSDLASMSLP